MRFAGPAAKLLPDEPGRFLARGGRSVTLEGEEETSRVVILEEFPTLEIARAFYDSEPYREVIALREGAATAQFFAIEGVEAP